MLINTSLTLPQAEARLQSLVGKTVNSVAHVNDGILIIKAGQVMLDKVEHTIFIYGDWDCSYEGNAVTSIPKKDDSHTSYFQRIEHFSEGFEVQNITSVMFTSLEILTINFSILGPLRIHRTKHGWFSYSRHYWAMRSRVLDIDHVQLDDIGNLVHVCVT